MRSRAYRPRFIQFICIKKQNKTKKPNNIRLISHGQMRVLCLAVSLFSSPLYLLTLPELVSYVCSKWGQLLFHPVLFIHCPCPEFMAVCTFLFTVCVLLFAVESYQVRATLMPWIKFLESGFLDIYDYIQFSLHVSSSALNISEGICHNNSTSSLLFVTNTKKKSLFCSQWFSVNLT